VSDYDQRRVYAERCLDLTGFGTGGLGDGARGRKGVPRGIGGMCFVLDGNRVERGILAREAAGGRRWGGATDDVANRRFSFKQRRRFPRPQFLFEKFQQIR
jgi:hypothetical protein